MAAVPAIKPLLSKSQWLSHSSNKGSKSGPSREGERWPTGKSGDNSGSKGGFKLSSSSAWRPRKGGANGVRLHSTGSEEHNIDSNSNQQEDEKQYGIRVTAEIALRSKDESSSDNGEHMKHEWDDRNRV